MSGRRLEITINRHSGIARNVFSTPFPRKQIEEYVVACLELFGCLGRSGGTHLRTPLGQTSERPAARHLGRWSRALETSATLDQSVRPTSFLSTVGSSALACTMTPHWATPLPCGEAAEGVAMAISGTT